MDVPDPVDPRIVYRFNFVQRVWIAVWEELIEIAKIEDVRATDTLIRLAHLWRENHSELCDGSHERHQ